MKRLFKHSETNLNKEIDSVYKQLGGLDKRTKVLVGTGVPSDKEGRDGDIYINRTNKQIYYKEAGKWV